MPSLTAQFDAGTIDNTTFGHPDHVRLIWELIHAEGVLGAVSRFETGLKRIAAGAGHPEKYHATITHAFAFLVGERIAEQGPLDWHQFQEQNADLFEWPNVQLMNRYPNGELDTQLARRTFVLPSGS